MEIRQSYERKLLALMTQKPEVLRLIELRDFRSVCLTDKTHKSLFQVLRDFYYKYKKIPSSQELQAHLVICPITYQDEKAKLPLLFVELSQETVEEAPEFIIDYLFKLYKTDAVKELLLANHDNLTPLTIDETLNKLSMKFTKIQAMGTEEEVTVDYKADKYDRNARYQAAKGGQCYGIQYPWPYINAKTGGQAPGTLWVIRGAAKAGKSMALVNIANAAVKAGKNVIYFTLEVSKDVLENRLDALNTELPINAIKYGDLRPAEEQKLMDYYNSQPPAGSLIIVDRAGMSPDMVKAKVQELKQRMPIDMIIVDYLGLMRLPFKTESRWVELGECALALRNLAKEEKLAVVTANQTNRKGETANSIEVDRHCDILIHLERDNKDAIDIEMANIAMTATIVLAREGGAGSFPLTAQFDFAKLTEVPQFTATL